MKVDVPVNMGDIVYVVVGEQYLGDKTKYYEVRICKVYEVSVFSSGKYTVGVMELNQGVGHTVVLDEDMFYDVKDAVKKLYDLRNNNKQGERWNIK